MVSIPTCGITISIHEVIVSSKALKEGLLGLYWDNGKENGSYYMGTMENKMVTTIMGLYQL